MSDSETKPVKRRDVGMASVALIISQVISTYQSTINLGGQIDKLKGEIQELRVQSGQYVRKDELTAVSKKIDKVNSAVTKLSAKIKGLHLPVALYSED